MKFLFPFLVLASQVVAQESPDSTNGLPSALDTLLRSGIDAIMRDEFGLADSLFSVAMVTDPNHPAGPVMRAAVLHLRAEDDVGEAEIPAIESFHEEAERRASAFSTNDMPGRVTLSFIASSRGIMSMEASQTGAWIAALRYAVAGAALGEEILRADSSVADAGLTTGSYYYWKSRRIEVLMWLPFVTDNREDGLTLLRACALKGSYQRYAAISSLGWVLRDAGKTDEARMWLKKGLEEYPDNRALLRGDAAVLETEGRYQEASRVWERIFRSFASHGLNQSWGAFEAWLRFSELLGKAGDSLAVRSALERSASLEQHLDRTVLTEKRAALLERSAHLREAWMKQSPGAQAGSR